MPLQHDCDCVSSPSSTWSTLPEHVLESVCFYFQFIKRDFSTLLFTPKLKDLRQLLERCTAGTLATLESADLYNTDQLSGSYINRMQNDIRPVQLQGTASEVHSGEN